MVSGGVKDLQPMAAIPRCARGCHRLSDLCMIRGDRSGRSHIHCGHVALGYQIQIPRQVLDSIPPVVRAGKGHGDEVVVHFGVIHPVASKRTSLTKFHHEMITSRPGQFVVLMQRPQDDVVGTTMSFEMFGMLQYLLNFRYVPRGTTQIHDFVIARSWFHISIHGHVIRDHK